MTSRGDVVLVPFDFTDRSGAKLRPAVVVSSGTYHATTPDALIAAITGNLAALAHPGDYRLVDWQAAGLLRPSLVQTKLATVERSLIVRTLGRLSRVDLAAVERGLREVLELLGLADGAFRDGGGALIVSAPGPTSRGLVQPPMSAGPFL